MAYAHIEPIADAKKLERILAEEGFHIAIMRWRDTAFEIAPDIWQRIRNHFVIYEEIAKSDGLSASQALMFIDGLLGLLPDKDRKRLMFVQASNALK